MRAALEKQMTAMTKQGKGCGMMNAYINDHEKIVSSEKLK